MIIDVNSIFNICVSQLRVRQLVMIRIEIMRNKKPASPVLLTRDSFHLLYATLIDTHCLHVTSLSSTLFQVLLFDCIDPVVCLERINYFGDL